MSWQHFKQTWLIKFWAPAPAVIAAGILSTYYFGITGTFWAALGVIVFAVVLVTLGKYLFPARAVVTPCKTEDSRQ